MFQLVPFQLQAKHDVKARFANYKRVLLQSATGSGKTVIAVDFIRDWLVENPGKNVLCLFNLQCLLPQFEESFTRHRMRSDVAVFHDTINRAKDGTMMVNHQDDLNRRVMLTLHETITGSMQGEGNEKLELDKNWIKNVGLILIDEAHKGTSSNYQFIVDKIDCQVLGLTATPMRVKNKERECLCNDWEYSLVTTVSIRELIEMGRLVPPIYYDIVDDGPLFETWLQIVKIHSAEDGNYQSVWFLTNTRQAKYWEEVLLEKGQTCGIITSVTNGEIGTISQTPKQREEIIKKFENCEITHLLSVQALCEGFDAPIAKYCIFDRRVGNKALYQQCIGRVLRPYEGKRYGHVIDRCGNHELHGDIEDYVWDLEAEAANSVVVKLGEGRVIDHDKAERATHIHIKCDTPDCPNVYDMKKNTSCPLCGNGHSVEIEMSIISWMLGRFPNINSKTYPNLIDMFAKATGGNSEASIRLVNRLNYIFDEDGNISKEYQALYKIAKLKPKTERDLKKTFRYST